MTYLALFRCEPIHSHLPWEQDVGRADHSLVRPRLDPLPLADQVLAQGLVLVAHPRVQQLGPVLARQRVVLCDPSAVHDAPVALRAREQFRHGLAQLAGREGRDELKVVPRARGRLLDCDELALVVGSVRDHGGGLRDHPARQRQTRCRPAAGGRDQERLGLNRNDLPLLLARARGPGPEGDDQGAQVARLLGDKVEGRVHEHNRGWSQNTPT